MDFISVRSKSKFLNSVKVFVITFGLLYFLFFLFFAKFFFFIEFSTFILSFNFFKKTIEFFLFFYFFLFFILYLNESDREKRKDIFFLFKTKENIIRVFIYYLFLLFFTFVCFDVYLNLGMNIYYLFLLLYILSISFIYPVIFQTNKDLYLSKIYTFIKRLEKRQKIHFIVIVLFSFFIFAFVSFFRPGFIFDIFFSLLDSKFNYTTWGVSVFSIVFHYFNFKLFLLIIVLTVIINIFVNFYLSVLDLDSFYSDTDMKKNFIDEERQDKNKRKNNNQIFKKDISDISNFLPLGEKNNNIANNESYSLDEISLDNRQNKKDDFINIFRKVAITKKSVSDTTKTIGKSNNFNSANNSGNSEQIFKNLFKKTALSNKSLNVQSKSQTTVSNKESYTTNTSKENVKVIDRLFSNYEKKD